MAEADYYGTGQRKTAVARVWLRRGEGKVLINDRPLEEFAPLLRHRDTIQAPLDLVGLKGSYDVVATTRGGGVSSQAEALRHGVARALLRVQEEFRTTLKRAGYLTRDPRAKERKKFLLRGARRGPQFSKR